MLFSWLIFTLPHVFTCHYQLGLPDFVFSSDFPHELHMSIACYLLDSSTGALHAYIQKLTHRFLELLLRHCTIHTLHLCKGTRAHPLEKGCQHWGSLTFLLHCKHSLGSIYYNDQNSSIYLHFCWRHLNEHDHHWSAAFPHSRVVSMTPALISVICLILCSPMMTLFPHTELSISQRPCLFWRPLNPSGLISCSLPLTVLPSAMWIYLQFFWNAVSQPCLWMLEHLFSLSKKSFPLLFTWLTPTSPSGFSSVGLPLERLLFPPDLIMFLQGLIDHVVNLPGGPLYIL